MSKSRRGFLGLLGLGAGSAVIVAAGVSGGTAATVENLPAATAKAAQLEMPAGTVIDFFSHYEVGCGGGHTHSISTVSDPSHAHGFTTTTGMAIPVSEKRIWTGSAWVPLYSPEGKAVIERLTNAHL
jgi:hypothetical protein